MIDPTTLVNKYIAYDEEDGACWFRVTKIAHKRSDNDDILLLTNHMVVRNNGRVQYINTMHCFEWKAFKNFDYVVLDPQNLNLNEEQTDKLFVAFLGADDNHKNAKALDLGLKDLIKECGSDFKKVMERV
jgi:hypothetical protein